MTKWLVAYVITLILFPRVKPYVEKVIDNEYVIDVSLGIGIFIFRKLGFEIFFMG